MSKLAAVLQRYPALSFALYRRYWFASLASIAGHDPASTRYSGLPEPLI